MEPLVSSSQDSKPRLQKTSLARRTADIVRQAILLEEYKPGERLRESEFVKLHNVSSSVVREAFLMLEGEGIIVNDPYRGRSVVSIGWAEASDLALMRCSLESLAAFLAAERLTTEGEARIRTMAQTMKTSTLTSLSDWVSLERSLHRTIWEASGDSRLVQMLDRLITPMFTAGYSRHFTNGFEEHKMLDRARHWEESNHLQGHQILSKAISSRDAPAARAAAVLHVSREGAAERLIERFFDLSAIRKQVEEFYSRHDIAFPALEYSQTSA